MQHGEAPLSAPTSSPEQKPRVAEIWAAYQEIMRTRRPKGDKRVALQLKERFGISEWEWTRLKRVYDLANVGDEYAVGLLQQVDTGEITVSTAYRLVRERDDDEDTVRRMSSLKLEDVLQQAVRADAFFKIAAAALRRGIRINPGGLSPDEVQHAITTTRAAGLAMKRVADELSRKINGGHKTDDE